MVMENIMVAQSAQTLEVRIDGHEDELKEVWRKLEKIENRPPAWCTVALTAMGAALGSLITVVLTHLLGLIA